MEKNPEQLNKFLSEIDEVGSLIKDLTSSSGDDMTKSMKNADDYLERNSGQKKAAQTVMKTTSYKTDNTGVNRSVINQEAYDDRRSEAPMSGSVTDAEAFMKVMENDVKERTERKKKSIAAATLLKEEGNREFKEGNYEKAADFYSQGLELVRDFTALYTNRAQAYIKLEKYADAISDCDWALRVYENCLKAHIHKGRAYLELKKYDEAKECYTQAKASDPSKASVIEGYIAEVELAQKTAQEENEAHKLFEEGDTMAKGLVDMLDRIKKPDQPPLFYTGGLKIMKEIIVNTHERTLFRTHGGMDLINTHCFISRCFFTNLKKLSKDELDMCAASMDVMDAACTDNEENQKLFLGDSKVLSQLLHFLQTERKHIQALKTSTVNLLYNLSQHSNCRTILVKNMDITQLMACLFQQVNKQSPIASTGISLLNNLALDKQFKKEVRGQLEEDVLPSFEDLLEVKGKHLSCLPCCITTISNLCGDTHIRAQLMLRTKTWQACCSTLERHVKSLSDTISRDIVFAMLGLLINVSLNKSDCAHATGPRICQACYTCLSESADPEMETRSLTLLGNILVQNSEAVEIMCQKGIVKLLVQKLENESVNIQKAAVKCLTSCTLCSSSAQEQIVNSGGVIQLAKLLRHTEQNISGNAALCLSHCVKIPKLNEQLVETNIVQDLLVLARDGKKEAVQQNAGMLLAKLAQSDTRHLEKLRDLHGLGILHDVIKFTKLT